MGLTLFQSCISSLSLNLSVVFLLRQNKLNKNTDVMIIYILIGLVGLVFEAAGGAFFGKNPGDVFGKWSK